MARSGRNNGIRDARRIKTALAAKADAAFTDFMQRENDRQAHLAASAWNEHRESHGERGDYRGTRDVMGVVRHAVRTIKARQDATE